MGAVGCFLGFWWYYRKRRSWRSRGSPSLPHRWESGVDELDGVSLDVSAKDSDLGLMGKSVPDEGVMELEASAFGFADDSGGDSGKPVATNGLDGTLVSDPADQLGLLADVQQEIKEVCRVLSEKDGDKQDFFSMMELVKAKFPAIGSHPLRGSLLGFIREHVPFYLSSAELEDLWG